MALSTTIASRLVGLSAVLLGWLLPGGAARAQGPAVVSTTPARHALAAPRPGSVAVTFSQPVTAASAGALRVFGSQVQGRRAGTVAGGGTSTLTFTPARAFMGGERLSVSVPATLSGTNGQAAARQTFQFLAATGGTGRGYLTDTVALGTALGHDLLLADVDNDGDLDAAANTTLGLNVIIRYNNGTGRPARYGYVTVAAAPGALAFADLDNDGDLDLLATDLNSSSVTLCLNDGQGNFAGILQGAVSLALGSRPASLATGDIDSDGDIDFISANEYGNSLSVARNNGSGGFSISNFGQSTPRKVVLADVDNDGDLDLLTASATTTAPLTLRLNDGLGNFAAPTALPLTYTPVALALTDVDADGDLDLLATNNGSTAATGPVSLCLNAGPGTFGAPALLPTGPYGGSFATALQTGDFDADGDQDVVVGLNDVGLVQTYANNGQGAFTALGSPLQLAGSSTALGFPLTLGVGDADSDGDLDVLAVDGQFNGLVLGRNGVAPPPPTITGFSPAAGPVGTRVVVTGTGFVNVREVRLGSQVLPTSAYTVNSATRLTLTVPAGAASGTFRVSTLAGMGTSATAFTVWQTIRVLSTQPARHAPAASRSAAVAVTYDQDITASSAGGVRLYAGQRRRAGTVAGGGTSTLTFTPSQPFGPGELVDLTLPATLTGTDGRPVAPQVVQFRAATGGTGQGVLSALSSLTSTVGNEPWLAVGDVDGDGDADVVLAGSANGSSSPVQLFRNNGAGTYGTGATLSIPAGRLLLADVDADGDLDLLSASGTACAIRLNDGNGSFGGTSSLAVSGSALLEAADLDADGDLDLLAGGAYPDYTVYLYRNDGTGSFGAGSSVVSANTALAIGDVDNNGTLDLVSAGNSTLYPNTAWVEVASNRGDGTFTFTSTVMSVSATYPDCLTLADLDADGDLDVLATTGPNVAQLALNNGNGTWMRGADVPLPVSQRLQAADLDGDGDLDLLGTGNPVASVRLNDGLAHFGPPMDYAAGAGALRSVVADFDGDLDLDLLVVPSSGAARVLQNGLAPAPTLTSATPGSAPVGSRVTLLGTNLGGTRSVTCNGAAAAFVVENSTQVYATVPAGATVGAGQVVLTTPAGTASLPFEVTTAVAVTSFSPVRNALGVAPTASVQVTFGAAITAASASQLRVFGNQRQGRRTGTLAGGGTSTLTFTPSQPLAPGEAVSVTLPASLRAGSSGAVPPQVWQFRAAAGGSGVGNLNPAPTPLSPFVNGAVGLQVVEAADLNGDGYPDPLALASVELVWALSTGPGTYGTARRLSATATTGNPHDLLAADVDGDGDLDVLMGGVEYNSSTYTGGSLALYRNDGQGNLSFDRTLLTPPGSVGSLQAGDFDADGDLDLAVNSYGADVQQIYFNDGQANYTLHSQVTTPGKGWRLHVADLDGDGDLDLVGTGASNPTASPTVNFSLNDGTGTFRAGPSYSPSGTVAQVALGDLDGDGDVDMFLSGGFTGGLQAALNNGQGGFTPGYRLPITNSYADSRLQLGDLDGDGDLDLCLQQAINASGPYASSEQLQTWLNNGQGAFVPGAAVLIPAFLAAHTLADVDADGDLDPLLLTQGYVSGTFYSGFCAFLNRAPAPVISSFTPASGPTGTTIIVTGRGFTGATEARVGGAVQPFILGSDTQLTITTTAAAVTGSLSVTTPNGTGTSTSSFTVPLPSITSLSPTRGAVGRRVTVQGSYFSGATQVRFNGTTARFTVVSATELTAVVPAGAVTGPLVVATPSGPAATTPPFEVLPTPRVLSSSPASLAVAAPTAAVQLTLSQPLPTVPAGTVQLFGSQRQGLRTSTLGGVGTASLTLTPAQAAAPGELLSVSVSPSLQDANGDTLRPLVYQYRTATAGTGRGVFGAGGSVALTGQPGAALLGDVDGDGDLDAVTLNNNLPGAASSLRSFSVRFNDGAGNFSGTTTQLLNTAGGSVLCYQLLLADVDNDHDLDILALFGANVVTRAAVVVLRNDGSGAFAAGPELLLPTDTYASCMAVTDVNADGRLDLILGLKVDPIASTLAVCLGTGQGTFGAPARYGSYYEGTGLVLGDLDGDGDLDAVMAGPAQSGSATTIRAYFNDGRGTFSPAAQTTFLNIPVTSLALGDLDGDGDLDLATGGSTYSYVRLLLNNGNGTFAASAAQLQTYSVAGTVTLGDVDADGDLDILTSGSPSAYYWAVSMFINQGGGQFSNLVRAAMNVQPGDLAMGDVDGDGDLDVLVPNGTNQLAVRLNGPGNPLAGTASRAAPVALAYPNPATGRFALAWPGGGAGSLTLRDALGRPVLTQPLPTGPATVEVSVPGLAAGVYVLELATAGNVSRQPLVLR